MQYHLLFMILSLVTTSFTMLCAQRLLIGQTPWSPPFSYCDHCQRQLKWWQLIPVIGYLIQLGRCHFCHQRIPAINCGYELAAMISTYLLLSNNWTTDSYFIILNCTLVFLATTDYYQQIIYEWALPGLLILIPWSSDCWLLPWQWQKGLLMSIVCAGLLWLVYYCHGLGIGDVEFILLIIVCRGPISAAWMIVWASVLLSARIMIRLISFNKRLPFIPYLSGGLVLSLILN